MKKWVGLVVALCLTLPMITGCSSKDYPDALELIKESQKEMKDVKSMSFDMSMVMDITMTSKENADDSMSMKTEMSGEFKSTVEPFAMHGKTATKSSVFGQDSEVETETYTVVEGDKTITYESDGTDWYKSEGAAEDVTGMLTSFTDAENMKILEKADLKVIDTEKVNGKETYVVECTFDKDLFKDIIEASQTESLNGMDLSDIEEVLGDDFSISYKLYINQKTKEFVRISMDLSKIMDTAMKEITKLLGEDSISVKIKQCEMKADFKEFNKVDAIVVPEDVKTNAYDLDAELDYDFDLDDLETE